MEDRLETRNPVVVLLSAAATTKYGYDKAGNTTSFTGESFIFNQRGRMSSATSSAGTTDYVYNALGQLIEKTGVRGDHLLRAHGSLGYAAPM
jgi:YD repeat-containing protein